MEVGRGQRRIRIIEHLAARDFEHAAGCGKLFLAQGGQLLIRLGVPAMLGCLSGCKTYDKCLGALFAILQQSSSERCRFVIGVSGNTK